MRIEYKNDRRINAIKTLKLETLMSKRERVNGWIKFTLFEIIEDLIFGALSHVSIGVGESHL